MDNKINRLLKIISSLLLLIGVFSKHLHYQGASIEIVLSSALIIFFTLIDCIAKKDRFNIIIGFSICVMFVGAIFKSQHWIGAAFIAGFGVGASIVITILMSFRKDNSQLSQQNTLSVFLLLIFIVTLMSNNPLSQLLGDGDTQSIQLNEKK